MQESTLSIHYFLDCRDQRCPQGRADSSCPANFTYEFLLVSKISQPITVTQISLSTAIQARLIQGCRFVKSEKRKTRSKIQKIAEGEIEKVAILVLFL